MCGVSVKRKRDSSMAFMPKMDTRYLEMILTYVAWSFSLVDRVTFNIITHTKMNTFYYSK